MTQILTIVIFNRDTLIVTFGNAAPIEIRCKVNSSNPELTTTLDDNNMELQIPFIVETDIVIRG